MQRRKEEVNPNTAYSLRQLVAVDCAEYQALRMEGLRRCSEFFRVAPEDESDLSYEFLAERLATSFTVGAFVDEAMSGIASLTQVTGKKLDHKALLWGMYVREEVSNRGIGKALIEALLDHGRTRYESILLTAVHTNSRALHLYETCGFKLYATEPRSIRQGLAFVDEAYMRFSNESYTSAVSKNRHALGRDSRRTVP
jgi:ribosomal protein S18 acetylase RimI-like enzyme